MVSSKYYLIPQESLKDLKLVADGLRFSCIWIMSTTSPSVKIPNRWRAIEQTLKGLHCIYLYTCTWIYSKNGRSRSTPALPTQNRVRATGIHTKLTKLWKITSSLGEKKKKTPRRVSLATERKAFGSLLYLQRLKPNEVV